MERKSAKKSSGNNEDRSNANLAELFAAHNLLQSNPLALLQQQMNVMAQQAGPAFFNPNQNPYNNPAATWLYLDYISRIQAAQQMLPGLNDQQPQQQQQQQQQEQQQQQSQQQRRSSSTSSAAATAGSSGINSAPSSSSSRPKQSRPAGNKKIKLPADTDIIRMGSANSSNARNIPPPTSRKVPTQQQQHHPTASSSSSTRGGRDLDDGGVGGSGGGGGGGGRASRALNTASSNLKNNQIPKESPPSVQLFKILEDLDAPLNLSKKSGTSKPHGKGSSIIPPHPPPPPVHLKGSERGGEPHPKLNNNNVTIIPHAHTKPENLSTPPGRYPTDFVPKPAHMAKSTLYSHVIPKIPQVGMVIKPNEKLAKKKTTVASLLAQSRVQQQTESSATSSRSNSPESGHGGGSNSNNIDIRSSPTSAPHRPWVNNPAPLVIPSVKKPNLQQHQQQQLPPPSLSSHKQQQLHQQHQKLQLKQQKQLAHLQLQEKVEKQLLQHHRQQQQQQQQQQQSLSSAISQQQQSHPSSEKQQRELEREKEKERQKEQQQQQSQDSAQDMTDPNSGKDAATPADLNQPLSNGWKRETLLKGLGIQGLSGEVVYISPGGVRCKQLTDVKKHLAGGMTIKMFNFSSRLLIGDFLLPTNSAAEEKGTTLKLSANQLANWLSSEGEENKKEETRQKEERERKKQHSVLIRALELHRRSKRRQKLQNDRKLRKRAELAETAPPPPITPAVLPHPTDANADTDELNSEQNLPDLSRVKGLRLSPHAFANLLQIYEFLHTFGETLGFDMDSLPSISNLQKAFLHVDENEEELLSVMSHLLVCAVEDPGMPNPNKHITAFGQTLKQADITFGSLSEVLRLFMEGVADSEPEAIKYSGWLNEAPFLALSPTRKSTILAFICDLLLQNKAVLKHLESSTENAHTARKERQQNDIKVRRLRMLCARKAVAAVASEQQERAAAERESSKTPGPETPTKSTTTSAGEVSDDASKDTDKEDTDKEKEKEKPKEKETKEIVTDDKSKETDSQNNDKDNHDQEIKDKDKANDESLSKESGSISVDTVNHENEIVEKGKESTSNEKEKDPTKDKEEISNSVEASTMPPPTNNNSTTTPLDPSASPSTSDKDKASLVIPVPVSPSPSTASAAASTTTAAAVPDEIDSEDQLEESESDADAKLSVEEIRMKMNQLNNMSEKLKKQVIENFKIIRSASLGQDRWRRRYWNLPNSGGIFVEGGSTSEFPELRVLVEGKFAGKEEENMENDAEAETTADLPGEDMDTETEANVDAPEDTNPKHKDGIPKDKDKIPEDKDKTPQDKEKIPQDKDEVSKDKDAVLSKDKDIKDSNEIIKIEKENNLEENSEINTNSINNKSKKGKITGAESPEVASEATDTDTVGVKVEKEDKDDGSATTAGTETAATALPPTLTTLTAATVGNDDQVKLENGEVGGLNSTCSPITGNSISNSTGTQFEVPPPVIKIFSFAPRTGCSGKAIQVVEKVEEPESEDQILLDKIKDKQDVWEGWWRLTDEDKDEYIEKVCAKGIREKNLKNNLMAVQIVDGEELDDDEIPLNVQSPPQGWDPELSYKVHLQLLETMETLEERVGSASLQVKGWQLPSRRAECLSESDIIEMVKERLLDLESAIERRYLKPPLGKSANDLNLSNLTELTTDKDKESNQNYQGSRALTNWRDGVNRAETPGVLSMAIYTLDSSIAWDKSVMKASCQLCKGGDNEDKLLLCDACDRGYHTYCFKPPLEQIPDGDWFCWECINKATGIKGCIVCGKQSGGGKILACDKCVKAYHLDCLNPPLAKAPRGRWHCPDHRKLSPSRKRKSENSDKTPDGVPKQQKSNNKKAKTEANWCEKMLEELAGHEDAWPFLDPVNTRQFPTYKKVIKNPMDIATIRSKLATYKTREMFLQDVRLIFDNCETFNEDDSPVGKAGHSLRIFFESKLNNCK